jgi:hypothetical protein
MEPPTHEYEIKESTASSHPEPKVEHLYREGRDDEQFAEHPSAFARGYSEYLWVYPE